MGVDDAGTPIYGGILSKVTVVYGEKHAGKVMEKDHSYFHVLTRMSFSLHCCNQRYFLVILA